MSVLVSVALQKATIGQKFRLVWPCAAAFVIVAAFCTLPTCAATRVPVEMPTILIETDQEITNRIRMAGRITVFTNRSDNAHISGTMIALQEKASVGVRGSGSSWFKKKSYRIELQDEAGNDKKVEMLGVAPESDWILLACYTDKTFMRDVLSYELWRQMGHWAPQWRYVELFLKTNSCLSPMSPENKTSPPFLERTIQNGYQGLYVLVENIKRGRNRLDIRRLKPDDNNEPRVTGGYILKRDRMKASETGVTTSIGIRLTLEEPKERDITAAQKRWLTDFLNDLERTLLGKSFLDATNGYRRYVDTSSFIDYHWMIEASKNVDGHWFSQFYHKDRVGPLKAGPVWDWDMAFGNLRYHRSQETNGWRSEQVNGSYYAWYGRMFEDEEFLQQYVDRWSKLRSTVLATTNVLSLVDEFSEKIRPAAVRTIQRWFPPSDDKNPNRIPSRRFDLEVQQMRDWIRDRLGWIDSQEFPKPIVHVREDHSTGKKTLTMECSNGKLFFTTDGSDPRASGGGVSSKAIEYSKPIDARDSLITARVRSEFGLWSAPVRLQISGHSG